MHKQANISTGQKEGRLTGKGKTEKTDSKVGRNVDRQQQTERRDGSQPG